LVSLSTRLLDVILQIPLNTLEVVLGVPLDALAITYLGELDEIIDGRLGILVTLLELLHVRFDDVHLASHIVNNREEQQQTPDPSRSMMGKVLFLRRVDVLVHYNR
jgi:hypothetical protein